MQASEAHFDFSQDYAHQAELHGLEGRPRSFGDGVHYGPQWALLTFDQPVTAPQVPALFLLLVLVQKEQQRIDTSCKHRPKVQTMMLSIDKVLVPCCEAPASSHALHDCRTLW